MARETKIKPCPFCGSENCTFIRDLWFVACNRCGATGPGAFRKQPDAIQAWNTRCPDEVIA